MKLTWINSTALKEGFRIIKTRMTKSILETSKQAMPFGFDANPSKNYIAILAETMSNEEPVIVGYLNPKALDSLNIGDSMQYSTDENGNIKAKVIARNDGTLEILGNDDNAVRYSILKSEYDKTKTVLDNILSIINGPPIPEPGNGAPSALQQALAAAVVNLQTGNIAGSKIEEIKVPK
jgi:hypothetical protein